MNLKAVIGKDRTQCPECMKIMLKRNIKRHLREKHKLMQSVQLPSAIVDPQSGLHMVAKSVLGPMTPVHVILKTTGPVQTVLCDDRSCREAKDATARTGYGSFTCRHVEAVRTCSEECHFTNLSDVSLKAALDSKAISEKTCTSLKKNENHSKGQGCNAGSCVETNRI